MLLATTVFLYFSTDIFRTKRGAFIRYFKTTDQCFEIFKDKEFTQYNKNKRKNCYIRKGNLKIIDSSNVAESGIMDKLSATINIKSNKEEEQKNIEVNLFTEGSNLGQFSFFHEKDIYGFFCPDVSPDFIGVKNSNFGELIKNIEYKHDGTLISTALVDTGVETIDFLGENFKDYPIDTLVGINNSQKNKLNNYYRILKNNVPADAYYGENDVTINIDGNDYKVNQYVMNVSGSQSATLQIALLNELSKDSIMMDFLASKMALFNFSEEYRDVNKLNEKIQTKIGELSQAPANAKDFKIVVSNYKQQNIQTEIYFGDTKIVLNNLEKTDDRGDVTNIIVNNTTLTFSKKDNHYVYGVKTKDDNDYEQSIKVDLNREGKFEDNNISNKATIYLVDGIKKITFEYEDVVQFVSENDLGIVNDFGNHNVGILNDYSKNDLAEFVVNLKNKINQVYILKGSQVGINLDPLFK